MKTLEKLKYEIQNTKTNEINIEELIAFFDKRVGNTPTSKYELKIFKKMDKDFLKETTLLYLDKLLTFENEKAL